MYLELFEFELVQYIDFMGMRSRTQYRERQNFKHWKWEWFLPDKLCSLRKEWMMPFNCSYRNKNEPTAIYPSLEYSSSYGFAGIFKPFGAGRRKAISWWSLRILALGSAAHFYSHRHEWRSIWTDLAHTFLNVPAQRLPTLAGSLQTFFRNFQNLATLMKPR